jgi:hypothetical protein
VYKSLDSRNALVRQVTRWLLARPQALQSQPNDIATLTALMVASSLQFSTPPHRDISQYRHSASSHTRPLPSAPGAVAWETGKYTLCNKYPRSTVQ